MTKKFNYKPLIEYTNYEGKKYVKPEKAGDLKEDMELFRKNGQNARKVFTEIAKALEEKTDGFHLQKVSSWMNQAQIARPYLWVFLRQDGDSESESGIALRVFKNEKTKKIGISLEVSFVERKIGESIILEIHNLGDELKDKIKEQLVEICHGEYALVSGLNYHSFNETVKELVNHRIPSNINRKVGVIGELLLNVLIREFTDIKIVSPFFNLEERNVKKGFDIIAVDPNKDLWIIESKAGELGKLKTSTEKVRERINTAKRDLDTRLNMHNSQLWLNAVNSVRSALDDTSEKNTIVNILNKNSNSCLSNDKNVILGGTVFCIFNSTIDSIELRKLYNSILSSNKFSKLKLIAIQKQTYQAIIDFLVTLV